MAAFSASDVAFEGFRITRERTLWLLGWTGVMFVVQAATLLILGSMVGSAFTDLQAASSGQPNPTRVMEAYGRMAPAYSIIWPLTLLASAVISCAIYRAVLRPQEPSLLGMKIGGDELRVLVVSIALGLLFVVAMFVGIMVVALVAGGVGAAAGEGAGLGAAAILGLAVTGVLIFAAVRLSLALPMTFEQKDFRVFESWRATQGGFWPLFGAYLLAFVLGVLVVLLLTLVLGAVGFGVAMAFGQQTQGLLANLNNPAAITAAGLPIILIYSLFNALVGVFFTVILTAPPAAAWRQLSGPEKVFA